MQGRLSVVVGAQFGSEGKGAIAGHLTKDPDRPVTCVRVGGPNAGHTVLGHGPEGPNHPWRLRTIPVAAVTNPNARLVIAAGSEIDLAVLQQEAEMLEDWGHTVWNRLAIDHQATVLDQAHIDQETTLDMHSKIGSTGKGIGAARAARIMRTAKLYKDTHQGVADSQDTAQILRDDLEIGTHIIIEGTQGYGLGLHQGHYPQCTSNDARAIDFLAMTGLNPWEPNIEQFQIYAVARVYPIRVAGNSGPLNNETTWEDLGLEPELTTVTRKIRRVGLWDGELVREAVRANGASPYVRLAITMLDQEIPECAGMSGNIADLPDRAIERIRDIERETKAQIAFVGTGPDTVAS